MTETAAFEALRASPLATELTEAQCRTLSTLLALRELADGARVKPRPATP